MKQLHSYGRFDTKYAIKKSVDLDCKNQNFEIMDLKKS